MRPNKLNNLDVVGNERRTGPNREQVARAWFWGNGRGWLAEDTCRDGGHHLGDDIIREDHARRSRGTVGRDKSRGCRVQNVGIHAVNVMIPDPKFNRYLRAGPRLYRPTLAGRRADAGCGHVAVSVGK